MAKSYGNWVVEVGRVREIRRGRYQEELAEKEYREEIKKGGQGRRKGRFQGGWSKKRKKRMLELLTVCIPNGHQFDVLYHLLKTHERRNYNTPMHQQGTFGLLLIVAAKYLIRPTIKKYIRCPRPNADAPPNTGISTSPTAPQSSAPLEAPPDTVINVEKLLNIMQEMLNFTQRTPDIDNHQLVPHGANKHPPTAYRKHPQRNQRSSAQPSARPRESSPEEQGAGRETHAEHQNVTWRLRSCIFWNGKQKDIPLAFLHIYIEEADGECKMWFLDLSISFVIPSNRKSCPFLGFNASLPTSEEPSLLLQKIFRPLCPLGMQFSLVSIHHEKIRDFKLSVEYNKKALIQFGTLYFIYSASPIFQLRRYHRFSTPCGLRHHQNWVDYWTTWSETGIKVDSGLRLTDRATTCFYVQITNAKACTTIGISWRLDLICHFTE
ncbi:hypothetical protein DAPPUDRAFT_105270 [Daphnia pulex]|uniref:Uncharacterized protein n=1 Tax=Daphnia pulex TaxID=6669 RepID=E9GPZ0_DAPPU|nr:hypothetical protein DAPPUDRAFT_105270 [Daphnia pulex]|eukprot:EFX78510.1 hypothetical protein DAPPUDRAFT_105270 [Daphnia pulex]